MSRLTLNRHNFSENVIVHLTLTIMYLKDENKNKAIKILDRFKHNHVSGSFWNTVDKFFYREIVIAGYEFEFWTFGYSLNTLPHDKKHSVFLCNIPIIRLKINYIIQNSNDHDFIWNASKLLKLVIFNYFQIILIN